MCVAVPVKIEKIVGDRGTVVLSGARTDVSLALVEGAKVGEWVLVHAGFALTRIDEKEAMETYEILRQTGVIE